MPDEKIVRLFISHSWDHDEDYIGLIRILRKIDQFDFYNYSVPEQDPLEADSDKEITIVFPNKTLLKLIAIKN